MFFWLFMLFLALVVSFFVHQYNGRLHEKNPDKSCKSTPCKSTFIQEQKTEKRLRNLEAAMVKQAQKIIDDTDHQKNRPSTIRVKGIRYDKHEMPHLNVERLDKAGTNEPALPP